MTSLILPRAYDRVVHSLKAGFSVPAGAHSAEVTAEAHRCKEEFVRLMSMQGYEYSGRPMALEGPEPYFEPRGLPKKPERRRYRPGEPRHNREAEARAGMDKVVTLPPLVAANRWRFKLVGDFHAYPILAEMP